MQTIRAGVFSMVVLALGACGDPSAPGDGGRLDGSMGGQDGALGPDAAGHDGGSSGVDAGPADDAGSIDSGSLDAGSTDGGSTDGGSTAIDAGSGVDAGPGTPPPPPPAFTALFSTRPAGDGPDGTLEDAIVALIDDAVPGSRIRVAIYTFTRARGSSALIRAHDRGVDVRVVLDGGNTSAPASELAALRAGLGAARVTVCDAPGTACVGSGIMHHKTFLFSALGDGSRDVVVQGSHNLSNSQRSMHNNLLVVRGDAALFAAYERTWNDLRADVEIPNYYRIDAGDLATRAYFFPRVAGDTVVSVLDNVNCDSTSRIRATMAFFTNARLAIAERLAARQREGCDVRVVIGDAEIRAGDRVLSTLRGAGVGVTLYPSRSGGWSVHSKYLLIDAPYSGSAAHRRLVFTGSHNWTGPALTINDETMLRVEDAPVFDAYLADWTLTRAAAARP